MDQPFNQIGDNFPPFEPHPLIRGGHAQTLWGNWWPAQRTDEQSARHHVLLDDGDTLVLHDDIPSDWCTGGPVTLLMHGLAGCYRSRYMVRVAQKLNRMGVRTFRMNLRGCGAGKGLACKPYHAGRSDDVLTTLEVLSDICPGSSISLVGFSLSGNIVLKLLGETPHHLPLTLTTAVAVNPPIDLEACVQSLKKFPAQIYDKHFVNRLYKQVCQDRQRVSDNSAPSLHSGKKPRNLFEFDDWYTAPVSGFEGARDYYSRCSSAQFVPHIQLPTLILAACDDPLVPVRSFERLTLPENVTLHLAKGGGHLGYIGRKGIDPDRRWMDWRILDWILGRRNEKKPTVPTHASCDFSWPRKTRLGFLS